MTMAATDAKTEAAPLIPQSHGVNDGGTRRREFHPQREGHAHEKPDRTEVRPATAMRNGVRGGLEMADDNAASPPRMRASTRRSAPRPSSETPPSRIDLSVRKLPMLLASSRMKRTT